MPVGRPLGVSHRSALTLPPHHPRRADTEQQCETKRPTQRDPRNKSVPPFVLTIKSNLLPEGRRGFVKRCITISAVRATMQQSVQIKLLGATSKAHCDIEDA